MKTSLVRTLTFGTLLLSFVLTSCADPYGYGYGGGGYGPTGYGRGGYARTPAQGAVAGGLLGAAAGGIIGNQSSRGLEGAAIGGLLGALAGGVIQNSRQQRQYTQYNQPNSNPGYNQNYQQGNNQGYSQPNYPQDYQPQGGSPNYGYGQQTSHNPYAFGNWQ